MNEPLPLRAVVGASARRIREGAERAQDDVARAAQTLGLLWDRSRVAALERGAKAVSPDELILLPTVLELAGAPNVTMADLFDDDAEVILTGGVRLPSRDVARVLAGGGVDMDLPAAVAAQVDRAVRALQSWDEVRDRAAELGLPMPSQQLAEAEHQAGEAETKAAHRFGEPRIIIIAAAVELWGRSLTAERDARLAAELSGGAGPRTVQARRGHITRQLLADLGERLADARTDG